MNNLKKVELSVAKSLADSILESHFRDLERQRHERILAEIGRHRRNEGKFVFESIFPPRKAQFVNKKA